MLGARSRIQRMPMSAVRWSSTSTVRLQKVYEGPMFKSLQMLKRISVLTLGTTISISPVMFIMPTENIWVILGAMAAGVGTSALSTGLLQWCMNPYITAIYLPIQNVDTKEKNPMMVIETLSFFGYPLRTRLPSSDLLVASPKRAFTNWQIDTKHPGLAMIQEEPIVEKVRKEVVDSSIRTMAPDVITVPKTSCTSTVVQHSLRRTATESYTIPIFSTLSKLFLRPRKYFYIHPSIMTEDGTEFNNNLLTLESTNIPVRDALQKDLVRIHSRISSSQSDQKYGLKSLLVWDGNIEDIRAEMAETKRKAANSL